MASPKEFLKNIAVDIATPYALGKGFLLSYASMVVTCEQLVRGHAAVEVSGELLPRHVGRIIFTDPHYDLALVEVEQSSGTAPVSIASAAEVEDGDTVYALGQGWGASGKIISGQITGPPVTINEKRYICHEAKVRSGTLGSPLVDEKTRVVGILAAAPAENDKGYSLCASHLQEVLELYTTKGGSLATRCPSCLVVVFQDDADGGRCPHCGSALTFPSDKTSGPTRGVAEKVEAILQELGYHLLPARKGRHNWEIRKGSATIVVTYHEDSGTLTGDAILCKLPEGKTQEALYRYLLSQNHVVESLTFSIKDGEILLSLLIYDQHLNLETGLKMFHHLFEMADYYDDILVDQFGAAWIKEF